MPFSRVLRAGFVTGIIDGLFSSVLVAVFYGSTVTRLFQGVAATLLGKRAFEGGTSTALIGVLMHFGVAFAWSIIFALLLTKSAWLRRVLDSPFGVIKIAAVYGPLIWMVMSLIVIPLLVRRPPTISLRWWIQFFGHIVFVGLPIVALIGGRSRTTTTS